MRLVSIYFLLAFLGLGFPSKADEKVDWSKIVFYKDGRSPDVNSILPFLTPEEQEMHIQAEQLGKGAFFYAVYKTNSSYFLQVDCHLNYWKWNGITWEPQLDIDRVGFNCGAHFIFREDDLFSLGGYGFWRNTSDLVQLNSGTGQAEFVAVQDQPLNYYSATTFQLDDGVLLLYGEIINLRLTSEERKAQGKFLDMGKLEWKDIQLIWSNTEIRELVKSENFSPFFSIDLKDYGLLFFYKQGTKENGLLIFDKKNWSTRYLEGPFFDIISIEWYMLNSQNDIYFKRLKLDEVLHFQVESLVSKAQVVGKVQLIEPSFLANFSDHWEWILAIPFSAFLGILLWRGWKSPDDLSLDPSSKIVEPFTGEKKFADFISFQDQLISQEKMDELLGLQSNLNFELRKVKRARLLKMVNSEFESEFGFPLITRERDQNDRRMILYKIEKISPQEGVKVG